MARVDYAAAAELIERHEALGFIAHLNPDADAVGSVAAPARLAGRRGKRVACYCQDPVPANQRFIAGSELFSTDVGVLDGCTLLVVIDCSEADRIGDRAAELLAGGRSVIQLDHHSGGRAFGTLNLIDPGAAASGVLVYELLRTLGWELDVPAAEALYAAIETDTGSFHYPNTTPRCLRVVAELLEIGLEPQKVAQALYESHRPERIRLLGRALQTLELRLDGRLALLTVSRAMLAETGAAVEDTDEIVDYARGLAGVEVGAFLREEPDGSVKLSLRSKGAVRVDELARGIGGGGHPCAAGASFAGDLQAAREWIIEAVGRALERAVGDAC
jgi:phosphoesterase RecJ-like protein